MQRRAADPDGRRFRSLIDFITGYYKILGGQTHPGDGWEEGEGDGRPSSIRRHNDRYGVGPLVCQITEADKPQDSPHPYDVLEAGKYKKRS